MFDWDKAINERIQTKKQGDLLNLLDKLVENILKERRLTEDSDNIPGSEGPFDNPNFSIPLPAMKISEAWGKHGTKDREIIEAYTKNIPGSTFEEKINNLNKILSENAADNNLSQIVSTMMVCEILYSILTDFTESAGGFIFEGFLAGLFGGEAAQVKGPEDIPGMQAKGKPITDVILGGKHYSLKLLAPGTGVKGSFQNMVGHFESGIDHVVYLDARRIEGNQGLEFLEFEITLDNFVDVFVTPVLIEPGKSQNETFSSEKAEDFKASLEELVKEKKAIKLIKFGSKPKELGLDGTSYEFTTGAKGMEIAESKKRVDGENMSKLIKKILSADNETLQKYAPFGISYAQMKFEGSKAEKLFGTYSNVLKYKELIKSGDKMGAIELLKSLPGAQQERGFEFTPKQAASITGARSVGKLMVGEQYMKKAWASYADLLKRTIGPVYQELKQFSDDLNAYVLGEEGEDRKQRALDAIEDSKRLNVATENAMKELGEK